MNAQRDALKTYHVPPWRCVAQITPSEPRFVFLLFIVHRPTLEIIRLRKAAGAATGGVDMGSRAATSKPVLQDRLCAPKILEPCRGKFCERTVC